MSGSLATEFRSKRALVTGGTKGMGEAIVHGAEEGCTELRDDHEPSAADWDVRDGELQRHR